MCNHHLKDSNLSLKAKGLLSMMLSLPDEWNYQVPLSLFLNAAIIISPSFLSQILYHRISRGKTFGQFARQW